MNITKQLIKLGLNGYRSKVYLAVLALGRVTILEIAKETRLKRTTIYDIVSDLVQDGYIAEAKRGKRRLFVAVDPVVLIGRFEQKLLDVKELVPFLSQVYSKKVPRPTVRFYDGVEGCRSIMEEILAMNGKEQLWWSQVGD